MAIWVVSAFPTRSSHDNCHVETFWHNKRGAKARYDELVRSGKYIFVYLSNATEAFPSGVD